MAGFSSSSASDVDDIYNLLDDDFNNILAVLNDEELKSDSSSDICDNVSYIYMFFLLKTCEKLQ